MSFRTYTAAPSAAVATNGTFTFTLEDASVWGQIKNQAGHVMYAEGLQAQFASPGDFTMSVSGATVTVTYKGTTSIPAGSTVKFQLNLAGEANYLGDGRGTEIDARNSGKDYLGNPRWDAARLIRVSLGAPAVGVATTFLNASAIADTVVHTFSPVKVCDVPRNLTVKSSASDTAVITIRGTDEYGVAVTEAFTLNGTTPVDGKKAFKTVISYQAAAGAPSNNISIGNPITTTSAFGLPFFIPGGTSAAMGYIVKEILDGTAPTAGTCKGGDTAAATATTGDVRGTYTPNAAPDGSKVYELLIMVSDETFKGVPQFGT